MAFEATYNSAPGGNGPEDGPLGSGWSSSLDMRAERMLDGSISVVQEDGSAVQFRRTSGGQWATSKLYAATLVDNGNNTLTYTRNKLERFTFKTPGSLGQWSTRIGRLESMSNLSGDTTTVAYPSSASLEASSISSGSRSLSIVWESGRIKEVKDQLEASSGGPRKLTFGYTGGDLTSATDASGGSWAFTYDANHRMKTLRKPGRTSTQLVTNVYDASGRVESQTDELGRQTLIDYEFGGHQGWTLVTEPGGIEKRLDKYDAAGLRVATIQGYGTTNLETRIEHNADFATTKVIAPGNKETVYTPHANGQPAAITDPTGRTTRFGYHPTLDLVTSVEVGERNGSLADMVRTEHTYSSAGLVTSTSVASNKPVAERAVTQYLYTDPSHPSDLKEVIDPRGKHWLFGYDSSTGDQTSGTDPENYKTSTTYNAVGWPVNVKAPKLIGSSEPDHVTSYSYDVANRTTIVTNPAGDKTKTALTAFGDTDYVVTGPDVTGTNGDKTDYSYDAAGQLTAVDPSGPGAQGYDYWPTGDLKTYTNELGATTVTHYDGAGRIDSETDEAGRVTAYGYNAEGLLGTVQAPGGSCTGTKTACTTYSYDAAGRQTRVDYSDATADVTDIDYDGVGRRKEAFVGGTKETWDWSPLSEITAHKDVNGDTTAYQWDRSGNLEKIWYPGKTTPVVREFDDAGRLEKVIDFDLRTATFDYDDFGNWKTSAFGSGSSTVNTDSYAYDAAGRMTAVTWKQGATTLGSETYSRPTATKGMVDTITPTGAAGSAATASDNVYDGRDRLLDTRGVTSGNQEFALDGASNLTKGPRARNQQFNKARELCWTSTTTTPSAASLSSCPATKPDPGAELFTYDGRGRRNTTSFEDNVTRTHTYDQADRLTKVSDVTGAATPAMSAMDGQALTGNFDGDTEDDVFFYKSSNTPSDDYVFWGARRNQFGSVNGNFSVGSGYTPATGDFNCDGIDDIIWYKAGSGSDYVWFWFGRHNTSSANGAYLSKQFTITNTFVPVAGDFNADGCADILWYAAGSATDAIWWGDDDVAVGTNQFDLGAATVGGTFEPVAGDFDGNGADDVFWYAPGTDQDYVWMFAASGGTYSSFNRTVNTTTYDLAAGDVNGDERDDLLFYNPSGSDVLWWGAAEANFGSANQKTLPSIDAGHAPALGDFDGDGREDLLLYKPTTTGDTIWWGAPQADFSTVTGFQNTTSTHETTYSYDADGLRAAKQTDGGAAQKFTYSTGGGLPLLMKETTGSSAVYIIYGPNGHPVEQVNPDGSAEWLHHDQVGSVRLATSAVDGAAIFSQVFGPYGEVRDVIQSGGVAPLLGYAGEYLDVETGYQYLRARYFDRSTGQFLVRDPAVGETRDPYGYAGANPANATDPSGKVCLGDWCTPKCPFGETDSGGCNGAGLARNPWVQTAVVVAACTTGVGCVAANVAVVAINAQDRWDGSKGVAGNLTDPGFVTGTAVDIGLATVNLRSIKELDGAVIGIGKNGGSIIRQGAAMGAGGRLPLNIAIQEYWLRNLAVAGTSSLFSYELNSRVLC